MAAARSSPHTPRRTTTPPAAGRQRTREAERKGGREEGGRKREGAPLGSAVAAELALKLLLPVAIPRPQELPLRCGTNGGSRREGRLGGEGPATAAAIAEVAAMAAPAAAGASRLVVRFNVLCGAAAMKKKKKRRNAAQSLSQIARVQGDR